MATTFKDHTGNGTKKDFDFPFPYLLDADVKVSIDQQVVTTPYNITLSPTKINFTATTETALQAADGAPKNGLSVRVFRDTDVDAAKAIYASGSSVRAGDLNDNQDQLLYALQEEQNLKVENWQIAPNAVTTDKIKDGTIVDADISATAEINVNKLVDGSARQVLQTAANGTDVEWTSNVDIPGTLDVTGAVDFDSTLNVDSNATVSGTATLATVDINAGAIDGTTVGAASASTGAFTTLSASGTTTTAAINASGAVGIDGDFDINTNKFTVASATGNTVIAGTLSVTGDFDCAAGSIDRAEIAPDAIDGTKIDNDAVDSEHIAANSLDTEHYASGSVDATALGNNAVQEAKIANTAVSTNKIADNAVTIGKIADAAIVTDTEQAAHTVDNNTFFTTKAAEARYFNASTGETIKNGDTFPDNDTTIATTAAINDRIIDIVDDVGGFVPLVNEAAIPASHPESNNAVTADRTGTILSIGTLSATYTPSSGTVTIPAGTLSNHSVNATITDCGTTVLSSGFGVLVETKAQTNSQYAAGPSFKFHRLTPKATEVTTVAGNIANINSVAANETNINAAVSNASNINAAVANATNINAVSGSIGNVNTAATNIAKITTVADDLNEGTSEIDTVATNINNVNNVGNSITNVNTVATNITDVNNFADLYQIGTSAPSTDGGGNALAAGDLWFDSSSNKAMKVHNGTAFAAVTPVQSVLDDIAIVSGNITFAEDLGLITDALTTGTGNSIETAADNIANIQRLGTADAVADMNTLGTADVVADLNTLGTADVVADMNTLGTADCVSDMNTLGTSSNVTNMNTLAGIHGNITTVAGISGNVTTVATNNANVTAVAGKATEIGRLGTADAVADMAILGTADVVADLNTLATADVVSDLNTLGTADVVSDMNTLGTSSNVTNMNTLAGISSDITAVAGKATEVGRLGTADAVADMAILGTADVVADLNTLGTAAIVEDLNILGTTDCVADMNTLATSSNVTNMNTCAGSITNINNTGGSISNVNTVAGSIADVNRYANEYKIASSAPSGPSEGDLWYDDNNNLLKYYDSSSWNSISAGIANIDEDTTPQLGGHLDCTNKNLTNGGTATFSSFVGALTGNVTGNASGSSGSCTGNAATATILANARTIGGVSFNGSANINLPGVNAAGNQNTSGTAAGLSGSPNISVGTISGTNLQIDFGTIA